MRSLWRSIQAIALTALIVPMFAIGFVYAIYKEMRRKV